MEIKKKDLLARVMADEKYEDNKRRRPARRVVFASLVRARVFIAINDIGRSAKLVTGPMTAQRLARYCPITVQSFCLRHKFKLGSNFGRSAKPPAKSEFVFLFELVPHSESWSPSELDFGPTSYSGSVITSRSPTEP